LVLLSSCIGFTINSVAMIDDHEIRKCKRVKEVCF